MRVGILATCYTAWVQLQSCSKTALASVQDLRSGKDGENEQSYKEAILSHYLISYMQWSSSAVHVQWKGMMSCMHPFFFAFFLGAELHICEQRLVSSSGFILFNCGTWNSISTYLLNLYSTFFPKEELKALYVGFPGTLPLRHGSVANQI